MYALNLNEEKRILSACVVLSNGDYTGMPIVHELPQYNMLDCLYIDGEYIYFPRDIEPVVEPLIPAPTQLDRIEAQIAYTALITGTLIPEEGEISG